MQEHQVIPFAVKAAEGGLYLFGREVVVGDHGNELNSGFRNWWEETTGNRREDSM